MSNKFLKRRVKLIQDACEVRAMIEANPNHQWIEEMAQQLKATMEEMKNDDSK